MEEKRKVWRPLKFQSVEDLQKKVDEYFLTITDDKWDNPASITWLALHLDTSRETLCDYQDKDEFSDTLKKAKLRIENAYEKRLIRRWSSWDIFALKNFEWKDKQEVDQKTEIKWKLEVNNMTPLQMMEYIKEASK